MLVVIISSDKLRHT